MSLQQGYQWKNLLYFANQNAGVLTVMTTENDVLF